MATQYNPNSAALPSVRIAIIGGGPGATEFVHRLNRAVQTETPVDIQIFEARHQFGRGSAWKNNSDSLIANMRLETLGPSYPHFQIIKDILAEMGHPEADREYPSRNAMGEALDYRWRQTLAALPSNWRCTETRATVVDLAPQANGVEILTDCGTKWPQANFVVLALGNIPAVPKEADLRASPRFLPSGWNHAAFDVIGPTDTVLLKGAGLTALDTTIVLLERGHQAKAGKIVWQSQSGGLPYVRPRQVPLDPIFLRPDKIAEKIDEYQHRNEPFDLRVLIDLVVREMRAQEKSLPTSNIGGKNYAYDPESRYADFKKIYAKCQATNNGVAFLDEGIAKSGTYSLWFSVAKLLDEYLIPKLWNALPDIDKRFFMDNYRRNFDRLWAPIPAQNARRLKEWIEDGTIRLLSNPCSYKQNDARTKIELVGTVFDPLTGNNINPPGSPALEFDYAIDTSGIQADMRYLDSILVQNLRRQGILDDYKLASLPGSSSPPLWLGAKMNWRTGQVISADGALCPWLYSLTGSLATGAHRFTNSFLAVSTSADATAIAIAESISGRT